MTKDEAKAATPHHDLIAQLLNPNTPKTEREHAASREIAALKAVQEPVAWSDAKQSELNDWFLSLPAGRQAVLLEDKWMLAGAAFLAGKTTPPAAQRQWVGLTDEDWQEIADKTDWIIWSEVRQAIEAKLKEKNGWYRQHVTDGSPCWCEPEISYTNPETGASVIVHKEPQ